jgi:hypothetical protein
MMMDLLATHNPGVERPRRRDHWNEVTADVAR